SRTSQQSLHRSGFDPSSETSGRDPRIDIVGGTSVPPVLLKSGPCSALVTRSCAAETVRHVADPLSRRSCGLSWSTPCLALSVRGVIAPPLRCRTHVRPLLPHSSGGSRTVYSPSACCSP